MIRVLIAGYHGFGNCGDEAILQAMTANIRAMAKDVEITALSYNPEFTKTEYGINLYRGLICFRFCLLLSTAILF